MFLSSIVPEGKQLDVLALPVTGHYVILGTAGSGKTTMALLRAIHLSNLPEKPKVLVVTFNRALVKYMSKIMNVDHQNIVVENYHKFARGYLAHRGKMPASGGILDNEGKEKYIKEAVEYYKIQYPNESTYKRDISAFVSEIEFIQSFGFQTLKEYEIKERVGRAKVNIKRENRKFFFNVYERYLSIREQNRYIYDWSDIAIYVNDELKNDTSKRIYDHIIIDEGQDFSPIMIRSLLCATNPRGSFSFFGDVSQQIYGSRLSWRDAGIIIEKSVLKFEKNYRNPINISKFANDITKSKYWQRSEDTIESTNAVAEGPKPVLIQFENRKNEIRWLASQIKQNINTSSNLIVCRNREVVKKMKEILAKHGIPSIVINKNEAGFSYIKKVYVSTFHSAKGLEFDNVYIPLLNHPFFPENREVELQDDDFLANELKLLYVAVTRAKFGLYMSYHKELSDIFPDFSPNIDHLKEEAL